MTVIYPETSVLNNHMEKIDKTAKLSGHGGPRKGAGRPKGSRDQVSIRALLDTLDRQTGGRDYEELLVEDFLQARIEGDKQTTLKYHNLILNKVMNSLAKIEVTDSKDAIEAKQAAFAEALAKLVGVSPDTK
jgi:hypothetical protein